MVKKSTLLIAQLVLLLAVISAATAQDPSLLTNLEQTEAKVQALRQLDSVYPVRREIMPADELRAMIEQDIIGERYSPEQAQRDAEFYVTFGFLMPGVDLRELTQTLATSRISTFYDPVTDTIYLPDNEGNDPLSTTFYAHHYTLALLRQNFAIPDPKSLSLDQAMAYQAVMEGDAYLTTLLFAEDMISSDSASAAWLLRSGGLLTPMTTSGVPVVLQRELSFPYADGGAFIQYLYDEYGDWRLVNLLYERPPLSTEHILHPIQYLLYDEPQAVMVPDLAEFLLPYGPNWTLIADDTLGEFYLREHLALILAPEVVDTVATGWGGDHFKLYTYNDQVVLAWKLVWDTREDAQDFNLHYGAYLNQWLGVSGSVLKTNQSCWVSATRTACKASDDDGVWVVIAPTADMAFNLLDVVIPNIQIIG